MIITLTIIGICACFGFIVILLTAVAKDDDVKPFKRFDTKREK